MTEVLKICKKHGDLTKEDVLAEEDKKAAKIRIRCAFCRREKDSRWRESNREKHRASASAKRNSDRTHVNEMTRKDREKNPEKYRKWWSQYKQNNKEKIAEWNKQDRQKNLEKYKKREKESRERNRDKIRRKMILNKHKLTNEQYEGMFKYYDNKCAICRQEETRRNKTGGVTCLVVDHCHTDLNIRGLLCHNCNHLIGCAKDDIQILQSAIEYLQQNRNWREEHKDFALNETSINAIK